MRSIPLLFCGTISLTISGCIVPVPPLFLNAPGYGQTYRICDVNGNPIQRGVIFLESEFHMLARETRVKCYEIRDGEARIPIRVLHGLWWYPLYPVPPFVLFFGWQNPDVTSLYVVAPGMQKTTFEAHGHEPIPSPIHLTAIDEKSERAMLFKLSDLANPDHWDSSSDKRAKRRLMNYLESRSRELGVRKLAGRNSCQWDLLCRGILPIYDGEPTGRRIIKQLCNSRIELDDHTLWALDVPGASLAKRWETATVDVLPNDKESGPDYGFMNVETKEIIPVWYCGTVLQSL